MNVQLSEIRYRDLTIGGQYFYVSVNSDENWKPIQIQEYNLGQHIDYNRFDKSYVQSMREIEVYQKETKFTEIKYC